MDFLHFRDLERLKRTGNFSQAAVLGNLSQPAFSRRIKALESWVGATLVDRTHQPVTLTTAGEQMLEAGLQALARIEQERSQILEAQSLPDKYVVTFGAQHSIGWRFYPAWLQELEDAYGPVLSRLRADDLPNCMRDLQSGDVDFVIAYASGDRPQHRLLESIKIGEDQLVPVCKPNVDGTPLFDFDTPGVRMPYLRFGDAAPIGTHLEPLFQRHRISDGLRTVYENSMAGALRIRAQAGDGVAWLPKSLVLPDLESGILVRTGRPDWLVDLSIRMFRNKERSNRVTRSIWTFLEVRQSVSLVKEG
ncbi:LysR family transcriptional regulator [Ruegeria aquimaris]|uniref:LysR family transcriptional regulator n=1 Tax=Ruegeria aquimaris TaxID=2984333 RepID=A0ABT3AFA9_9RHOB|nr:LysR family transcriptional regulator [Ruegeria sp. XHP0148]MCV2887252.1 LysR family transcriptional regulator [Ruegeria sp. XHP0148]